MSARDTATKHKNDGNAAFKKKQWDEAIDGYTKAISADPTWEVPYSNRSQVYYMTKNFDKAYADGCNAIKVNPEYVKGYHRAVNALIKLNRWTDAMSLLDKAYKKGFRANKDLSKLDGMVREKAEAEEAEKVKRMSGKDKLKAKGNQFFKEGNYDAALDSYQKCLECCKKDGSDNKLLVSLYCNRAICYQQQSAFDLVIAECGKALELEPDNPKALMRRSSAFEGMEKYRLALQDVRRVLLRHPNMAVANRASHRLSGAVRRLKAVKKQ